MDGGTAELRQFGSLPMAGRLGRGAPVGGGVSGGTGGQGSVTLGLSDRLQLLGERATPAGAQEGRQAPAQALGGLLPGVIAEELAHGVSGEVVRKHGRRGRHVPLGLGGGGAVGLQQGQVAATEAALFHDATAAAVHAACRPAWKSEVEAAVPADKLEGVHQLPAAQSLTGAVSSIAARGQGQEDEQHEQRLPHRDPHWNLEAGAGAARLPAAYRKPNSGRWPSCRTLLCQRRSGRVAGAECATGQNGGMAFFGGVGNSSDCLGRTGRLRAGAGQMLYFWGGKGIGK